MSDSKMYCYQCFMVDHYAFKAEVFFWYEKDAKAWCDDKNADCVEGMPVWHYEKVVIS